MTKKTMLDRLPLNDALFIGFCAGSMIVCKLLFRWHLGINGHAMFFTVALLMLARGCVNYRWAASLTALLAGLMAMSIGLGKGGPLIVLKFLFPALVIDLAALLVPLFFYSVTGCMIVAAMAGASKFINSWLKGYLLGMDRIVLFQQSALDAFFALLFSCLGALFIPSILRKLKARGVFVQPQQGGE